MAVRCWKLVREQFYFETQYLEERAGEKKILGRSGKGRICCESEYVSRQHSSLEFRNGVFYIKDLKSTNGTFLNGKAIQTDLERELRNGDLIGLGIGNLSECPTDQYFLFRFLKCESEEKPKPTLKPKKKRIALITLEDEDEIDIKNVPLLSEVNNKEEMEVPKIKSEAVASNPISIKTESFTGLTPSVDTVRPELDAPKDVENSGALKSNSGASPISTLTPPKEEKTTGSTNSWRRHPSSNSSTSGSTVSNNFFYSDSPDEFSFRNPLSLKFPFATKPGRNLSEQAEADILRINEMARTIRKLAEIELKQRKSSAGLGPKKRSLEVNEESFYPELVPKRVRIAPREDPAPTKSREQALEVNSSRTFESRKNKNSTPRTVIRLDYVQGCRTGSGLLGPFRKSPTSSSNDDTMKPQNLPNPFGSKDSYRKLEQAKNKKVFPDQSMNIDVLKRNRSDKFARPIIKSSSPTEVPGPPPNKDKFAELQARHPSVNPKEAAQMPVMQIIEGMSKPNVLIDGVVSAVPRKPQRPPVNMDYYRTMMQKPGYGRLSNEGLVRINSAVPRAHTVPVQNVAGSIPQDQVYYDLLQWNPIWLQEQCGSKIAPPVTVGRKLVTNLPGYVDYESYVDTFYPLMLLELWASISQEYSKPSRQGHRAFERTGGGKCIYQAVVEKVDAKELCPMLPVIDKSVVRNTDVNGEAPKPYWHCIRLMTVTENKDLNRGNDFGVLTVSLMRNGAKVIRAVFGFFLSESELYEEINPAISDQCKLFPQNPPQKYKFSVTFVTHMKEHEDIIRINLCSVERFAYVSPKIRDFRAIAALPESRLFDKVINPTSPDAAQVFHPTDNVNVAGLVKDVMGLLNPIQRAVVQYISARVLGDDSDLMLVHGPPGTGKTRTIVGLVLQLLKANSGKNVPKQKLLVCTPSNTAIDELIRRLGSMLGADIRMVRIGQGGPEVNQFQLDELSKKHCSGASQLESLREAVRTTDTKIAQLELKIADLDLASETPNDTMAEAFRSEIEGLKKKKKLYVADLDRSKHNRRALDRAKIDVLQSADIVCSTLSSCCNSFVRKHLGPLKGNKQATSAFTCCIIDEATQTTEPESLAPLMLNCDKLILVGDPMQLPATVLSHEAESRDFGQSLFTRLFNFYQTQPVNPVMMLTQQYRMSKEILHWPNLRFYQNKLTTSSYIECDPRRKLRLHPYLFLNMNSQENVNTNRQISNKGEVKLVREILVIIKRQSALHSNHANLKIGIITPYNDQRMKLLKLLDEFEELDSKFGTTFAKSIEVDTVDSFQGREKDIVLLSCVRTEELGFLKTPQRLNVSLTRAKKCLFIIGNAACLNGNEMWRSLMDDAVRRGVYKTIPDEDPSHPEKYGQSVEKCLLLSTDLKK